MTPEDEEFNRLELESRIRKEAVLQALHNENERLGLYKDAYGLEHKRAWVGLTNKEIDAGLLRTNYSMQTAGAWRDGVEWAMKQLKEKNDA